MLCSFGGEACASFGPVVVEIHSGDPTGALLGSSSGPSVMPTITVGNPSSFLLSTFSSPPGVVAGSVYAIVITTTNAPGGPTGYIVGADGNSYPSGMAWASAGATWHSIADEDLAFKTFVTAAIPEYPLGLPLLAIFMVVAYGLIKRRTALPKN